MSIGVLAIGMIFVAGVFPVGIYFATVSTERTIAAVVADEAFAKIRLYADPNPDDDADDIDLGELSDELQDFNDVFNDPLPPPPAAVTRRLIPYVDVFAYPSDPNMIISQKAPYYWSALCRLTKDPTLYPNQRLVQVIVFVCKKAGSEKYWYKDPSNMTKLLEVDFPKPVRVNVTTTDNPDELIIDNTVNSIEKTFINDGYTIVDSETGDLYRVLERYKDELDQTILLDRPWKGKTLAVPGLTGSVWVIPPPVGGGRNPCIAVYQKLIRF